MGHKNHNTCRNISTDINILTDKVCKPRRYTIAPAFSAGPRLNLRIFAIISLIGLLWTVPTVGYSEESVPSIHREIIHQAMVAAYRKSRPVQPLQWDAIPHLYRELNPLFPPLDERMPSPALTFSMSERKTLDFNALPAVPVQVKDTAYRGLELDSDTFRKSKLGLQFIYRYQFF